MIHNHITAKLSALDLEMIKSIPEGGNWKNIPASVESKRVSQIRESFGRGEGSRSTYYGRLVRFMPSYTINTYFNRPGNGCHIHYEQDRVLSLREAARLQSFPDSFTFLGSQSSIQNQIGNAVPPLLAMQIASSLKRKASFIDLFCGAGGLGLGFKWAGWQPIISNDIDDGFLSTYQDNVHRNVISGSITDDTVFESLLAKAEQGRNKKRELWVLGGPPCQGFSTAGNKRSMDDPRNSLVWRYIEFLHRVKPDGFVFENVVGIKSMNKGNVFQEIMDQFKEIFKTVTHHVLSSENYGIPQRRKRVIVVGINSDIAWSLPDAITRLPNHQMSLVKLSSSVSVEEAISDLPRLRPGEDGTSEGYRKAPKGRYQEFMRGLISAEEYLDSYFCQKDSLNV